MYAMHVYMHDVHVLTCHVFAFVLSMCLYLHAMYANICHTCACMPSKYMHDVNKPACHVCTACYACVYASMLYMHLYLYAIHV
jgi:hypothetical protein